jgi:hypothetical protein
MRTLELLSPLSVQLTTTAQLALVILISVPMELIPTLSRKDSSPILSVLLAQQDTIVQKANTI